MSLIVGIDEAGLGPVLGPMVVSAAAFEVPDEARRESLWDLLAGTVARTPSKRRATLAIGDSKKLYSRKRQKPLEHLERGVLAMLASRGACPASLVELLDAIAPGARGPMADYPWYAGQDVPLPKCISKTDLDLSANALQVAMSRAGVRPAAMHAECVLVGEFNRLVRATRNKSTTLFDAASRLIVRLWRELPAGRLCICVDRHGGRRRYLPALQRLFDGGRFKVLDEGETASSYRVAHGGREGEIRFRIEAEQAHLPVALASMMSKYVRELFMSLFNAFWAKEVADLKPTAGYYVDGRRFYTEIQHAARRLGIDKAIIYRSR